jgi:hypothetical protein
MMSSTLSRDNPLWAMSKARLIGLGARGGDRRAGDSVRWLKERCAQWRRTAGTCCRVLVTGAEAGLAPQSAALALGRSLAESVNRVILIDLSQGAAALSGPMELPRSPGFTELCQQKAGFEEVIRRDPGSELHFLASGKPRSLAGEWGTPGMLDKVCRAIDETYTLALFCAEHDEGVMLARTLRRPLGAAMVLRDRRGPRHGADGMPPTDFEAFGVPLHWLEHRS